MEMSAKADRRNQLFIRAITKGDLANRDRLLGYTVGAFYNEQSLFIEEQEKLDAYYKSIKKTR